MRITDRGWEYEPDQRHAEMIVEQLGSKEAKAVDAPTEEEKKWEAEEDAQELSPDRQRSFRSVAARRNYIAADRPDLMYAVKCICRQMAKPTVGAWKKLKRVSVSTEVRLARSRDSGGWLHRLRLGGVCAHSEIHQRRDTDDRRAHDQGLV